MTAPSADARWTGMISGEYRPYVLRRHDDVSGISGTGPIAYALDLGGTDGVPLFWDTRVGESRDIPTHGMEWLPGMTMVELIHGHNGATTVEQITGGLESVRLEHLLRLGVPRLLRVAARLGGLAGPPTPPPVAPPLPMRSREGHEAALAAPWRVGSKLGRTVYAQTGCHPGEADTLLGMMETPHLAAYVVALHTARNAGGAA
jgi:hypothetical protein